MMDMPTSGPLFTWCNGQLGDRCICQKLDRVLYSDRALYVGGGGVYAKVLHREFSDHAPTLCSWKTNVEEGQRQWCFLRAWCLAEEYCECVRMAWSSIPSAPSVSTLLRKLKATQVALIH